ncbi:hypothetical protein CDAR_374741 [Caerostris darwini]|uniref:Uncharacterized protein n=1 Tax=Caerostris darwini TaxID=1538125 RepID=A0AAV4P9A8_9ARAC|nr:hypothetical protein CDAR_374741 [Caerostris darwini]
MSCIAMPSCQMHKPENHFAGLQEVDRRMGTPHMPSPLIVPSKLHYKMRVESSRLIKNQGTAQATELVHCEAEIYSLLLSPLSRYKLSAINLLFKAHSLSTTSPVVKATLRGKCRYNGRATQDRRTALSVRCRIILWYIYGNW